jgi:hypothetical protein
MGHGGDEGRAAMGAVKLAKVSLLLQPNGSCRFYDDVSVASPTHKRTEGRAPVWALNLLQNTPQYSGGSAKSLLGRMSKCAI